MLNKTYKQAGKIVFYGLLSLFLTHYSAVAQVKVPDGFTASVFATGVPESDGLAFDLDGNLYAASEVGGNGGGIYRVDAAGTVTPFVTGLNRADGLVFDQTTGFIYVSEEVTPGRVSVVDTSGNVSVVVPEAMVNNPEGIALHPLDGTLYIAEDRGGGRILIYDPASGDVNVFVSGLSRPEGITFDGAGNLYVAETAANQVLKVRPDGTVTVLVPPSDGMIEPDNILYNSTYDVLLVSEDASPNGRIFIVDPVSGLTTTFAKRLSFPQGMAFDASGNLYVSEQGPGRIIKIVGFKCCSPIINNGARYTRKKRVRIRILSESGVTEIRFSNDGVDWTAWRAVSSQVRRRLTRGRGLKTIHIQCRRGVGETCAPTSASIIRKRRRRE